MSELKGTSEKSNKIFKALQTAEWESYESKGVMLKLDEKGRERLILKLNFDDKKKYRQWLRTPEGQESLLKFKTKMNEISEKPAMNNDKKSEPKLDIESLKAELGAVHGDYEKCYNIAKKYNFLFVSFNESFSVGTSPRCSIVRFSPEFDVFRDYFDNFKSDESFLKKAKSMMKGRNTIVLMYGGFTHALMGQQGLQSLDFYDKKGNHVFRNKTKWVKSKPSSTEPNPNKDMIKEYISPELFNEFDIVYLKVDLPKYNLVAGDSGTIVLVHNAGYFEVEFGVQTHTEQVVTVNSFQITKINPNKEITEQKIRTIVRDFLVKTYAPASYLISESQGSYPLGAEFDSRAPWNQKDAPKIEQRPLKVKNFEMLYSNKEISVLKSKHDGLFWLLNNEALDMLERGYKTSSEAFLSNNEKSGDEIEYQVNSNIKYLTKGMGITGFEQGKDMVMINRKLAFELMLTYRDDEKLKSVLNSVLNAKL